MRAKIQVIALIVTALLSGACTVALRYPWDKQQDHVTPKAPSPSPTPEARQ